MVKKQWLSKKKTENTYCTNMQNMYKNCKKDNFLMRMEIKFLVMEIQDLLNQYYLFTINKEVVQNIDKCYLIIV